MEWDNWNYASAIAYALPVAVAIISGVIILSNTRGQSENNNAIAINTTLTRYTQKITWAARSAPRLLLNAKLAYFAYEWIYVMGGLGLLWKLIQSQLGDKETLLLACKLCGIVNITYCLKGTDWGFCNTCVNDKYKEIEDKWYKEKK